MLTVNETPTTSCCQPVANTGRPRRSIPRSTCLLAGMLVGACSAGIAWWIQVPIYQSTAFIKISRHEPVLLRELSNQPPSTDLSFERFRESQSQLVTSDLVLRKACAKPGVADVIPRISDQMQWMKDHLIADTSPNSELMELNLWAGGVNPHHLAMMVNAVQESYLDEIVNDDRNKKVSRLDELQRLLEEKREETRHKQSTLSQLRVMVGDAGADSIELQEQHQEIERLKQVSDMLAAEIHLSKIELSAPPRIQLLQPAESGREIHAKRRPWITAGVGILLSLLVTAGLLIWR